MEQNLVIIRALKELEALKAYLADKTYVAYDTETDGIEKDSRIIGFSVCADVSVGYYVILSEWVITEQIVTHEEQQFVEDEDGTKRVETVTINTRVKSGFMRDLETKTKAREVIQALEGKRLIMHNAIFDCDKTEHNFGVSLMPYVHTDSMILAHVVDENRKVGLKELGVTIFGEDAKAEKVAMDESVHRNGGVLTKDKYELYKGDADLIARYGAKDAILTLKVFYHLVEQLYEQGLDEFFYNEECMPLLRGPTYELNTVGLKVDPDKLQALKSSLETEILEAKAFIYREIAPHIKDKYPGTSKASTFNIGSNEHLAWLLFIKLGADFGTLTDGGKDICHFLDIRLPYSLADKRRFIQEVTTNFDRVYVPGVLNPKTGRMTGQRKIGAPHKYMQTSKDVLSKHAKRFKWVEKLLEYKKNLKLLDTYVMGIQERMRYNVIRPSFLQHGTTSGRYSSRYPNFQNLPRKDKRIKACIVSRPGKVFVGADYSQLEPRVFASLSKDEKLLGCFKSGEDFYSVVGSEIYDVYDCSLVKDAPGSFAVKHPNLRDDSKVVALASVYGATAPRLAPLMGKSLDVAQEIICSYFEKFPGVKEFMNTCHEEARRTGKVLSLFGRPRRLPEALDFKAIYGNTHHSRLPSRARGTLNLAVNHVVQSSGASIMNRAAIACWNKCRELEHGNPAWAEVRIVLQVHDELILEGPKNLADAMVKVLKDSMENTVILPGVELIAEPKVAENLADLK